jgi:hypothetical protein
MQRLPCLFFCSEQKSTKSRVIINHSSLANA